jgi:HD-like signal output (HDOD) protein
MANKRILIANADPLMLAEYGRGMGSDWTVKLVAGAGAALTEMAVQPFDVVVADHALPEPNKGVELLDHIHTEYPKTIRILLTGQMNSDNRIADVEGSHLILTKPCEPATLKSAIERALSIDLWLANDGLRELVARLRTFPIVPSLYLEVINALKSPQVSTSEVGAIIAKDMAMMTKLLQVTNSACFGLPRKISDPAEAVSILGFETVKSMVITLKLLNQYDKVKPVYFSIDRLWRHSTEVARISRRLVLTLQDDPVVAESAFTAGLMHDLGKLVLASNFDEQYSGAQSLARRQHLPLWEVEKQIFGASHGEIGAYLLGLWGMPLDLVEAAALHHTPGRCLAKHFTPLTTVHVANALYYEIKPDKDGFIPPQVDEDYLEDLGLGGQLKRWREIVLAPDFGAAENRARPRETGPIRKAAAAVAKPEVRAAKPAPAPPPEPFAAGPSRKRQRWVHAGMAVAVFLCTFLLGTEALLRMMLAPPPPPTRATPAKPPANTAAAAAVPAAPTAPAKPPEPPPAKAEEPAGPVREVSATDAKTGTPAAPAAPVAASLTLPAIARMLPPSPPPAAPVAPTAKDLAFAELQLQSIFYSKSNPSAVISGRRVRPQERLPAGAMVVAITPTSVTLEFESERKVLALK